MGEGEETVDFIISENARCIEDKLFSLIRKRLADPTQRTIVLVPAQSTFLMESQIIARCQVAGFFGLEVMSFEKLTQRILERAGGRTIKVLDETGLGMLAKKALGEATGLQVIDAAAKGDIHRQLARLLQYFKTEQVTPQQLEELAQKSGSPLKEKLEDISKLYQLAEESRSQELLDRCGWEAAAMARVAETDFLEDAALIVHGFDIWPKTRLAFLGALVRRCESCTITFEAAKEGILYERQRRNIRQVEKLAQELSKEVRYLELEEDKKSNIELVHLFNNIYRQPGRAYPAVPQNITLAKAKNRREEVRYAAQKILELTCKQGLKMREIGILLGDPQRYRGELQEVFTQAGIPYFVDGKRSLLSSPLAAFLLSGIDVLLYGWRQRDVLRHLKTGFLPVSQQEADKLFGFIREFGIYGSWCKTGFLRGAEDMETLRKAAFSPLIRLEESLKEAGSDRLPALLASYLEELGLEQILEEEAANLLEAGLAAEARFFSQLYGKVQELLEQTQAFSCPMSLEDWREVLRSGLESAQIAVVPPTVDEVVVGDVTHSTFPHKKAMLVLGANAGQLPKIPEEGGLLTQQELEQAGEWFGVMPGLTFEEQKSYIRRAFFEGDRLLLTYNEQDGPPSYLVERIRRLFPRLTEEDAGSFTLHAKKAGFAQLAGELRRLADGEDITPTLLPSYLQWAQESLEPLLPWLTHENQPAVLGEARAKALYGQELRGSVSLVEDYYTCPYKHFLDYGIRPQELRDFEEDAQSVGIYAHKLLEGFSRGLMREGRAWQSLEDEEIERRIAQEAEICRQEHNRGVFLEAEFQETERYVRQEVVYAARAIRTQLAASKASPALAELGFGFQGDFRLDTGEGAISLAGRIDRVDTAEGTDGQVYLRVVDYKTGNRGFSLTDFYYGLNLQLFVYLMAAEAWLKTRGKHVVPAGGFYQSLSMQELEEGEGEEERLKKYKMDGFLLADPEVAALLDGGGEKMLSMNLHAGRSRNALLGETALSSLEMEGCMEHAKTLIAGAAKEIEGGRLTMRPVLAGGKLPCDYCPYPSICRFDECYAANSVRLASKKGKEAFHPAEEEVPHEE